jgi:hypothetical protein
MFAHDLCHSQLEYFSLRLVDPAARRGMLSILVEKIERSDTTNLQSSIFNSPINRVFRCATTPRAGSPLRCDRLCLFGLGLRNHLFVFYGKILYWAIFTIFNIQFRFIRVGHLHTFSIIGMYYTPFRLSQAFIGWG